MTGEFPAEWASKAKNASILWRHHVRWYTKVVLIYLVAPGEAHASVSHIIFILSRVLVLSRWIYAFEEGGEGRDVVENIVKGAPSFLVSHTRSRLRAQTEAQGLGRHSKEDVMMLGERDVRSLSTFLGKLFALSHVFFCHQELVINNSKVKILVVVHDFNVWWRGVEFPWTYHVLTWLSQHICQVQPWIFPGAFEN